MCREKGCKGTQREVFDLLHFYFEKNDLVITTHARGNTDFIITLRSGQQQSTLPKGSNTTVATSIPVIPTTSTLHTTAMHSVEPQQNKQAVYPDFQNKQEPVQKENKTSTNVAVSREDGELSSTEKERFAKITFDYLRQNQVRHVVQFSLH